MSSAGSHSSFDLDFDEELALRIALKRSKVDIGGSFGSAASLQLPRQRNTDAGAPTTVTTMVPPPRRTDRILH